MALKAKEYLLRIDEKTWIELEKYSKDKDLNIAQIIRRAIKRFLNIDL